MVQTACYAIISHVFSENREKYIGYAEAVTGVGLMMGPVIGGPLYFSLGYFKSFCVFAAIMAISFIVSLVITPGNLNQSVPEHNHGNQVKDKKASFQVFLLNKRAMFSMFSVGIICFFMSYQSSFLTDVLRKEKGIPEVWNGAILALPCLTCTISCILVNYFTGRVPRRIIIFVAFVVLAFSMILQGPSEMLGLPNSNVLMLIGFGLNGFAQGFIYIPLLPDALEAVFLKEKIVEGQNHSLDQLISDYGSGLYGTFFSTGQILAPIAGGALYEMIGFRETTDFMAVTCLTWALVFFVFNVGFKIYSQERKIKQKMLPIVQENEAKEEEDSIEVFLVEQRAKWNQKKQREVS